MPCTGCDSSLCDSIMCFMRNLSGGSCVSGPGPKATKEQKLDVCFVSWWGYAKLDVAKLQGHGQKPENPIYVVPGELSHY